jgi:hypothetical protein
LLEIRRRRSWSRSGCCDVVGELLEDIVARVSLVAVVHELDDEVVDLEVVGDQQDDDVVLDVVRGTVHPMLHIHLLDRNLSHQVSPLVLSQLLGLSSDAVKLSRLKLTERYAHCWNLTVIWSFNVEVTARCDPATAILTRLTELRMSQCTFQLSHERTLTSFRVRIVTTYHLANEKITAKVFRLLQLRIQRLKLGDGLEFRIQVSTHDHHSV